MVFQHCLNCRNTWASWRKSYSIHGHFPKKIPLDFFLEYFLEVAPQSEWKKLYTVSSSKLWLHFTSLFMQGKKVICPSTTFKNCATETHSMFIALIEPIFQRYAHSQYLGCCHSNGTSIGTSKGTVQKLAQQLLPSTRIPLSGAHRKPRQSAHLTCCQGALRDNMGTLHTLSCPHCNHGAPAPAARPAGSKSCARPAFDSSKTLPNQTIIASDDTTNPSKDQEPLPDPGGLGSAWGARRDRQNQGRLPITSIDSLAQKFAGGNCLAYAPNLHSFVSTFCEYFVTAPTGWLPPYCTGKGMGDHAPESNKTLAVPGLGPPPVKPSPRTRRSRTGPI